MSTREASVAKIAEVLARHRVVLSYGTDTVHCACGAVSASREQHVAEALASAGIGWAEALSDEDVYTCVTQQIAARVDVAALGRAFGAKGEAHG